MKTVLMSITAASLIMAVAGCDGQKNAPVREGSETDYAFSFFRNVTAVEDDDANVFVSPYSAGVALGMLADGKPRGRQKRSFWML